MKKMLKRADGSYSQRGLWDNIRANKGSGKEPTKEMLKQEKKIKSSSKQTGGPDLMKAPSKYQIEGAKKIKAIEDSVGKVVAQEKMAKDYNKKDSHVAYPDNSKTTPPAIGKNKKKQTGGKKSNWMEESKELKFGGATDRYGNSTSTRRKTGGKKYQTGNFKIGTVIGGTGALQSGTGCVSGSCKEVMASEGTSYKGNGTNYTGPGAAQLSMKPKYQDRVVKKSAEQIAIDQGKVDAAQAKMAANQADRQARRDANLAAFKEATAPKPEVQYDFKRVYATEPALKQTGGKKKSNWLEKSKELTFGGSSKKKYQTAGPNMSFEQAFKEYSSGKMTAAQANSASGYGNKQKKYTDAENIDNLKKVFVGSHTVDGQGNVVAKPAAPKKPMADISTAGLRPSAAAESTNAYTRRLKSGGKKRMGGKNC